MDGGERVVDLAEVNGHVFVNNVSLGLYADAVQRPGYRDAKLRTILDTVPEVAGPEAREAPLSWRDPDGETHRQGIVLLVSNNVYRLGRLIGAGTRPSLNAGRLGVTVIDDPARAAQAGMLKRWALTSVGCGRCGQRADRDRRGDRRADDAVEVHDPAECPAGADSRAAPGLLAVSGNARRSVGWRAHACPACTAWQRGVKDDGDDPAGHWRHRAVGSTGSRLRPQVAAPAGATTTNCRRQRAHLRDAARCRCPATSGSPCPGS